MPCAGKKPKIYVGGRRTYALSCAGGPRAGKGAGSTAEVAAGGLVDHFWKLRLDRFEILKRKVFGQICSMTTALKRWSWNKIPENLRTKSSNVFAEFRHFPTFPHNFHLIIFFIFIFYLLDRQGDCFSHTVPVLGWIL